MLKIVRVAAAAVALFLGATGLASATPINLTFTGTVAPGGLADSGGTAFWHRV